jgi:hypothetical protein
LNIHDAPEHGTRQEPQIRSADLDMTEALTPEQLERVRKNLYAATEARLGKEWVSSNQGWMAAPFEMMRDFQLLDESLLED